MALHHVHLIRKAGLLVCHAVHWGRSLVVAGSPLALLSWASIHEAAWLCLDCVLLAVSLYEIFQLGVHTRRLLREVRAPRD